MIDLNRLKATIALIEAYEKHVSPEEYREEASTLAPIIEALDQQAAISATMATIVADEARRLIVICVSHARPTRYSEQETLARQDAARKLRELLRCLQNMQEEQL